MKNKMKSLTLFITTVLTIGLFSASVSAATGTIAIKDSNGGTVVIKTVDANNVVCNPDEEVRFTYCPPQLAENDPVIFTVVETGAPTLPDRPKLK